MKSNGSCRFLPTHEKRRRVDYAGLNRSSKRKKKKINDSAKNRYMSPRVPLKTDRMHVPLLLQFLGSRPGALIAWVSSREAF